MKFVQEINCMKETLFVHQIYRVSTVFIFEYHYFPIVIFALFNRKHTLSQKNIQILRLKKTKPTIEKSKLKNKDRTNTDIFKYIIVLSHYKSAWLLIIANFIIYRFIYLTE